MVGDQLLAPADTLDIDVVKVSLLGRAREAFGAAGEGEEGLLTDGCDGDFPGLVHALLHAGGTHEHENHEENHDDGDRVECAAVCGVEFHL